MAFQMGLFLVNAYILLQKPQQMDTDLVQIMGLQALHYIYK